MLSEMSKDNIVMVTYELQEPTKSKLFNDKKFVEFCDINSFLQNESILPCKRENSLFTDPKHLHILTRDLQFVGNSNLKKLISNYLSIENHTLYAGKRLNHQL